MRAAAWRGHHPKMRPCAITALQSKHTVNAQGKLGFLYALEGFTLLLHLLARLTSRESICRGGVRKLNSSSYCLLDGELPSQGHEHINQEQRQVAARYKQQCSIQNAATASYNSERKRRYW